MAETQIAKYMGRHTSQLTGARHSGHSTRSIADITTRSSQFVEQLNAYRQRQLLARDGINYTVEGAGESRRLHPFKAARQIVELRPSRRKEIERVKLNIQPQNPG
ncbi:MAG: hypothetical protein ACP5O7_11095 [Phycisphaerae bacterium]